MHGMINTHLQGNTGNNRAITLYPSSGQYGIITETLDTGPG